MAATTTRQHHQPNQHDTSTSMAQPTQGKLAAAEGQRSFLGDGAGSVGRRTKSSSSSRDSSTRCKVVQDNFDADVSPCVWITGGAESLSRPTRGRVFRSRLLPSVIMLDTFWSLVNVCSSPTVPALSNFDEMISKFVIANFYRFFGVEEFHEV